MSSTILEASPTSVSSEAPERRILQHLHEEAVISLDALVLRLPEYTWNQIFHAVDRLAREGKIVLRRHHYEYTLFSMTYAA
jgi:hypothetical protein